MSAPNIRDYMRRAIHAETLLEAVREALYDRDDPLALERARKRFGDTAPVYEAEAKLRDLFDGWAGEYVCIYEDELERFVEQDDELDRCREALDAAASAHRHYRTQDATRIVGLTRALESVAGQLDDAYNAGTFDQTIAGMLRDEARSALGGADDAPKEPT